MRRYLFRKMVWHDIMNFALEVSNIVLPFEKYYKSHKKLFNTYLQ